MTIITIAKKIIRRPYRRRFLYYERKRELCVETERIRATERPSLVRNLVYIHLRVLSNNSI